MTLHEDLALEVAQELGSTVNLPDVGILAEGILDIAVTHMYGAIRELTIEQGEDPAQYKLAATGGAGPLHAIALATMLGIETIVVPPSPGTFSAMGMLVSDLRHDFVRTYLKPITEADLDEIKSRFESMRNDAEEALKKDSVSVDRTGIELFIEMRYLEQSFVEHIEIDESDISLMKMAEAFSAAYEDRYGYCREKEMIEIVNLRLVATAAVRTPSSQTQREPARHQAVKRQREVQFFGQKAQCPIFARIDLARDQVIQGPAIIEEYASTTALFPDWQLRVDEFDNLIITRASS
jgi:N-methylhydantoinase A